MRGRRGVWVWIAEERLGDGAESASEKGRRRWCQ